MEAYLSAFVNFEHNNWAKLLPMAEFAYNNAKNASINHMLFKLNCDYYSCVSFKKNINFCFRSKSANKFLAELQNLMIVCQKKPLPG